MASSVSVQNEAILPARDYPPSPARKFSRKPYNKSFIDQVCSVKMASWPHTWSITHIYSCSVGFSLFYSIGIYHQYQSLQPCKTELNNQAVLISFLEGNTWVIIIRKSQMYLGQGMVLMTAYLIYALPSLNCLDNHNLKMTLYVSFLWKSLFQSFVKL